MLPYLITMPFSGYNSSTTKKSNPSAAIFFGLRHESLLLQITPLLKHINKISTARQIPTQTGPTGHASPVNLGGLFAIPAELYAGADTGAAAVSAAVSATAFATGGVADESGVT